MISSSKFRSANIDKYSSIAIVLFLFKKNLQMVFILNVTSSEFAQSNEANLYREVLNKTLKKGYFSNP